LPAVPEGPQLMMVVLSHADCKHEISTMKNRIGLIWCFAVLPEAKILAATRKFTGICSHAKSTLQFRDDTTAVPSPTAPGTAEETSLHSRVFFEDCGYCKKNQGGNL